MTWLRLASPNWIVEARRYGADGLPLGNAFTVSTFFDFAYSEETAVELRDDQSFIVGWGDGEEIFGRLYDSAGNPTTAAFQLSQLDPFSFWSFALDVGCEGTGRFRFFWATDINLEEAAPMTRTVTGAGVLGPLTQLDFPSHGTPGYSMTGDGEFIVTRNWLWGHFLEGERFDAQHTVLSEFGIEQYADLASPFETARSRTVARTPRSSSRCG